MQASLELEYSRSMVFFTWAGFDEMDDVSGSGAGQPSRHDMPGMASTNAIIGRSHNLEA